MKNYHKMKNRLFSLCFLRTLCLSFVIYHLSLGLAVGQTQLTDYRPGITPEGAIYFLPKTAIRLNVLIEKTTYQPGAYCQYAQRYLRMMDVPQDPSTSYRVVSVKQSLTSLPDSSKAYAVKFNPKTVAANIALSDDGCLLAINAQPVKAAEPEPFVPSAKEEPVNPRKFLTEEILSAGSTAKTAELIVREIYDLRENRNLLIKGQADFMPTDGNQMRLMLQQLEMQEQALLQLFTGTTVCDTTEEVITICPDGEIDQQVGFRLSQKLGLVDADDLSGAPYYIKVENLTSMPATDEAEAAKAKKKQPEAGIYVNVPGRMRITISTVDRILSTKEHPAAQFGNVELLSGELFNKHYTTHLWLNPLTGAVDRLEAEQPK